MRGSYYDRMSLGKFEQFLSDPITRLEEIGLEAETMRFEDEGFIRLAISPAGSKYAPGRKQRNALVVDVAPGYRTPFGHSIETRSPSGWSRVFGPEVWMQDLEAGPEFRSPQQSFIKYLKAAFDPSSSFLGGPQDVWHTLLALGQREGPGEKVAGGLLQYGPYHPEAAQQEFASRVTVGFAPGLNQQKAWQAIYQTSTQRGRGDPWSQLAAYAPWQGDDSRYRLRQVGRVLEGEEEGAYDFKVLGLGKDAADVLKRLNVVMRGGLRSQAAFYKPSGWDPETEQYTGLEEMEPGLMRDMNKRSGVFWSNLLFPGESKPRATVVREGMYYGAASPISGSMMVYDPTATREVAAFGEKTRETIELRVPHMANLTQAEFKMGVMKEKDGEWVKQRDLQGFVLEGGKSAVIGTYKIPGAPGEEVREMPLRVTAEGRPIFFGSPPGEEGPSEAGISGLELLIPPAYYDISGEGHPGPEMFGGRRHVTEERIPAGTFTSDAGASGLAEDEGVVIKKTVEQEGVIRMAETAPGFTQTTLERIEKNFPGEVRPIMQTTAKISIPIATMVGGSEKQGLKAAPWGITGAGQLMNQLPRARVGEEEGRISAFTGELKSDLIGFMYEFGSLTPEKMSQMAGEFGGKTGRELSRYITARQRNPRGFGREEGDPVPVSAEQMAKIYAETRGEQYAEEVSVYQMFDELLGKVEDLPQEYTMREYGRARFGDLESAPWTPIGYLEKHERSVFTQAAFEGMALGPEGEGEEGVTGLKARQLFRKFNKFEPVYRMPSGEATLEKPQVGIGEMLDPVETGQAIMAPTAQRVAGMFAGETAGRTTAMERNVFGLLQGAQERGYNVEGEQDVMRFMSWGAKQGINFANLGRGYKQMDRAQGLVAEQFPRTDDITGWWYSIRQPGLYATSASPVAPEHLARSPIIGYEEMASLSMVSEDIAVEMGLSLSQKYPRKDSYIPRHVAAWREIGETYRHQTSRTPSPAIPENVRVLTEDKRLELQRALFGQERQLTLDEMEEITTDIMGEGGAFYHPETQEMLESAATWGSVAKMRYGDRELQEPKNIAARKWPQAFEEIVSGGRRIDAGSALGTIAHQRRTVFASKSGTAMKHYGGRYVASALGGRYAAMTGVGLDTAVVTQERMDQMIRQVAQARDVGVTPKRMEQWREQITKAGGIPGVMWRSPVVSREYGALAMQFVTPDIVKERTGIDIEEATRMGVEGILTPGSASATGVVAAVGARVAQVIGDWDFDYATIMGLIDIDPETNEMIFKGGKGAEEALAYSTRERMRYQKQALREQVGAGGTDVAGGALSVIASEYSKIAFAEGGRRQSLSEMTPEQIHLSGMSHIENKAGMGRYYNVRRLLESSASTLGLGKDDIAAGSTAQTLTYQEYIDMLQTVGEGGSGATNLETLMQSVIFSEQGSMLAKQAPGLEHSAIWRSGQTSSAFQTMLKNTLSAGVGADVKAERIMPEAAAFMFQMPGMERQEMVDTIKGAKDPVTGLQKIIDQPDYDITKTPVGLAFMTAAWGKTAGWLGRSPREVEVEGGGTAEVMSMIAAEPFEWRGETIPVGNLGAQKDIALTGDLYQGAIRQRPFTVEQGARIASEWSRRSSLGHVNPQLLEYMVNQFGLEGDVPTLARATASAVATVSEEQVSRAIPDRPTLRGSDIPWMAYEPGEIFGGAYSEGKEQEYAAETREKMVAKQVFRLGDQSVRDLYPIGDSTAIKAGRRFENQMAAKLAPKLSHMLSGLTHEQSAVLPLHWGGENVEFTGTPDIMGVSEEGVFEIYEAKASIADTEDRARGRAFEKSMGEGVPVQVSAYASGLMGAAQRGIKAFKRSVRPWLDTEDRPNWERTAEAWHEAITTKGIRTQGLYGFQSREAAEGNLALTELEAGVGGHFVDWKAYAQPAPGGTEYPIGTAIQTTLDLMTPAGALPHVQSLIARGHAQGVPLPVGADEWVGGFSSWQPSTAGRSASTEGMTPSIKEGAISGADALIKKMTDALAALSAGQGGMAYIPGGPDATAAFDAFDARYPKGIPMHHTIGGGYGKSDVQARREVKQALIAGRTLIGGTPESIGEGGFEGKWTGFLERAKTELTEGLGIDPDDITSQNIHEYIGQYFGQDYDRAQGFISRELEVIKQMEGQGKIIERGYRTGVTQKRGRDAFVDPVKDLTFLRQIHEPELSPVAEGVDVARQFAEEARAKGILKDAKPKTKLTDEEMETFRSGIDSVTKSLKEFDDAISSSEDTITQEERARLRGIKRKFMGFAAVERGRELEGFAEREEEIRGGTAEMTSDQLTEHYRGYADALGREVTSRQAEGRMRELEEGMTPRAASQALRRMIGGFGLFYMGTLAKLGVGQYQQGYQEYQQYRMQGEQRGVQAFGAGAFAPYVSPEVEYQQAQIRSGGGVFGAMRTQGARVVGTPFSDVAGSALTGLGVYGLGMHVAGSMMAVPALEASGAALATTGAPLLGMAAGVGAMALTQYSYARQRDDSIAASAALGGPSEGGFWANWRLGGPGLEDIYQGLKQTSEESEVSILDIVGGFIKGAITGETPPSIEGLTGQPDVRKTAAWEADKYARWVGQMEIGVWPRDPMQVGGELGAAQKMSLSQIFGMKDIPELAHITPDIKAQLAFNQLQGQDMDPVRAEMDRMAEAGATPEEVNKYMREQLEARGGGFVEIDLIGTAMMAGTDVFGIGAAAQRVAGGAAMPAYQMQATDLAATIAKGTGEEIQRMQAGLTLMAKTPGFARQAYGEAPEAILEQAQRQWADIEGGPWEPQFLQRAQLEEERTWLGLETDFPRDQYTRTKEWDDERMFMEMRQNTMLARGKALASKWMTAGVSKEQIAETMPFYEVSEEAMGAAERATQMDPYTLTQMAMQGGFRGEYFMGEPLGNIAASMDISPQGQITGLPWGTTGLQRGATSAAQVGADIWGMTVKDLTVENLNLTDAKGAAVQGLGETFQGMAVPEYMQGQGGTRALQWAQGAISYQYQQDMQGIQQQQLDLQAKYQPQFWAIEDQQMALQKRQAQWGFQYQQRTFDLQGSQFYEQMATQRTGQLLQREWKQEDWGFQDLTRNMKWGWKQEDFQEQVRFMSGRERTLAERGMERETIMFNLEGGQIETQRERQEALWALEDERHDQTLRHFEQTRELQQQNMDKQREFFNEGFALRLQQQELQRAYWMEQHELQQQSLDIQVAYSEQTRELNETIGALTQQQEDWNAKLGVARTQWESFIQSIVSGLLSLGSASAGKATSSGKDREWWNPGSQAGGHLMPGVTYKVGERRAELFKPGIIGTLHPDTGPDYRDRWRDVTHFRSGGRSTSGKQPIIINIGKERLGEYVLDTITNELEVV